jgi:hypothetical protein
LPAAASCSYPIDVWEPSVVTEVVWLSLLLLLLLLELFRADAAVDSDVVDSASMPPEVGRGAGPR